MEKHSHNFDVYKLNIVSKLFTLKSNHVVCRLFMSIQKIHLFDYYLQNWMFPRNFLYSQELCDKYHIFHISNMDMASNLKNLRFIAWTVVNLLIYCDYYAENECYTLLVLMLLMSVG